MPPFVCPDHGTDLAQDDGWLVCPSGHRFAVRDGIPRFVSSEAYARAFGEQWKRFRETQLDSHTGLPLSRERALGCLGLDGPSSGPGQATLDGLAVLEVGCGAGRFTEVLLEEGALLTSVDLSAAVEANAENFPPSPTHRVAQADVRELPFTPMQFDVVFCLGVVQHTPDPEQTIRALYTQVKPGGLLAFDHYAISLATATWVGMHVARQIFRRLPADRKLGAVERMVDLLLPVHRAAAGAGRSASRALSRVSPVLSYHHVYPQLNEGQQREWAVLDTHDALTDRYKHHRRIVSLERTLRESGLEDIVVRRGGNGVEARGRRPAVRPLS